MALQHINQAGLDLIKRFEGLRLQAYADSGGVWTIGYGHTRDVKRGDEITSAGADILLFHDLSDAEGAVNQLVFSDLNPNQFSALVCFVFNIGENQFAGSTLLKRLNDNDYEGAASEFCKWNHDHGQESPGLTRRRQAEEELFRRPVKPLSQSRTIQAGTIAAGGSAVGITNQLYEARDNLSSLAYQWRWAAVAVAIITLIATGITLWARYHDSREGLR